MGPMSGEMSIAPIITAVELMLSPKEAINTAHIRIQRLAPLKVTPDVISLTTSSSFSRFSDISKYCFKYAFNETFSILYNISQLLDCSILQR